jgi:hypothetical protein
MGATQAKKLTQDFDYDLEEDEEYYVTRPHTSARRYDLPPRRDTRDDASILKGAFVQPRRSIVSPKTNSGALSNAVAPSLSHGWRHSKRFPLIAVIVGMLVMAALVVALSAIGSWWQVHQDDVIYGRPRTFQIEAVVGHNDSPSNPSTGM